MMDELLAHFLIEGPEVAQQGADALLELEARPDARGPLDDAFRAVHTLKGSAGLFVLPAMALALHAAEDVLTAVREGRRAPDRTVIGHLLATLDQTQAWLQTLSAHGELAADAMARAAELAESLKGDGAAAPPPPPRSPGGPAAAWALALVDALPAQLKSTPMVVLRYEPHPDSYFSGDDPLAIVARAPGLAHLKLSLQSEPDGPYDPFTCNLLIEAACAAPLAAVEAAFRFVPAQVQFAEFAARAPEPGPTGANRQTEAARRTFRVDIRRLDALAALADELVTAKTGLANVVAMARTGARIDRLADALAAQYGVVDRLVGQAHQCVMSLRMAPVRPLLRRFPQVVREIAASLGKEVELVIDGDGVEADRNIVEGLFEPLTHLLRNAIDHGVETPDDRLKAVKPSRARITLDAREQGGRLSLVVRDDGRGIDPEAIRAIAGRRKLVESDRLQAMDDSAIIDLIFLPGFSTTEAVTAVSGRGVGMDAVRAAVSRLGGRISVTTQVGVGTAVELSVPLTVSLTKVMVVALAADRYGVPMNQVIEALRLRADQVVPIRAGLAFNWRDRAVPLLHLSALTGGTQMAPRADQRVLVVRSGDQPIGLAIDAIEDRLDVAMRPLEGMLAGVRGLAGTTVLGDGQVLMILDPEALCG